MGTGKHDQATSLQYGESITLPLSSLTHSLNQSKFTRSKYHSFTKFTCSINHSFTHSFYHSFSGLPEGFSGPVLHRRGTGGMGRGRGRGRKGKKRAAPVPPKSPEAERQFYCPPLVLEYSSEVQQLITVYLITVQCSLVQCITNSIF